MSAGPAPTWRCSACDTYNDAGARACAVCETPRPDAAPAPAPASTIGSDDEYPLPWGANFLLGCGCLLLAAVVALITLVVLLILN
ncbi:zinc finger protein [Streptomyces sp. 6N223]|uniref:zinc finger protein n=1 Tax=Streptomyces sp. 6N223 TaxID=3457412 RepID=UPI003FD12233